MNKLTWTQRKWTSPNVGYKGHGWIADLGRITATLRQFVDGGYVVRFHSHNGASPETYKFDATSHKHAMQVAEVFWRLR